MSFIAIKGVRSGVSRLLSLATQPQRSDRLRLGIVPVRHLEFRHIPYRNRGALAHLKVTSCCVGGSGEQVREGSSSHHGEEVPEGVPVSIPCNVPTGLRGLESRAKMGGKHVALHSLRTSEWTTSVTRSKPRLLFFFFVSADDQALTNNCMSALA